MDSTLYIAQRLDAARAATLVREAELIRIRRERGIVRRSRPAAQWFLRGRRHAAMTARAAFPRG